MRRKWYYSNAFADGLIIAAGNKRDNVKKSKCLDESVWKIQHENKSTKTNVKQKLKKWNRYLEVKIHNRGNGEEVMKIMAPLYLHTYL